MKKLLKFGIVGFIAIMLIIMFNPVTIVQEGHRGLKFNLGKVNNTVLNPGITLRMPIIQKIKTIKITPKVVDTEIGVDAGGAITSDNQTIGVSIKAFYKYKIDELPKMWSNYGEDRIEEMMKANVTEAFKGVIGDYKIFEIPVQQEKIRAKVLKTIIEKAANLPIEVTELNILNYDWSDEFDASIAQTMQRAQQVKQKEQELLITEQEAQKQVKLAEAQKQSLITEAEGKKESAKLNAEAKILEGEGIQKYNQLIASNLSVEIKLKELEIEKIKAERWNGEFVPNNMYGPIPVDTKGGIKQ